MEAVTNILGNSTVLLVAHLIFIQQEYRTINILSEEPHDELLNKIMQIASNSLKPINHIVMGSINIQRMKFKGPILNVVVFNNKNRERNVSFVRENIFPVDVNVILSDPINGDEESTFENYMNLSVRCTILSESVLVSLYQNGQVSRIGLSSLNTISISKSLANYFSTISLQQKNNFTIFFQFFAPKIAVAPVENKFVFIGPDGSLAEVLAKWLNVTPIYCSDIGITYPNYVNWLDDPVIAPRLHYQFYYTKVLTKNVVTIFHKRITDHMQLHLSTSSIQEETAEENMKLETESLYPHEEDCLVIMVPKQTNLEEFLRKVIKNADIQSICIALLLFAIVRIIIEKTSWKQWISIFIKSLGIFLNQDKIKNENRIEDAWDINLRGFSVLATIALSVIIYKNLVSKQYVEIDTIEDLIASNLTIFAPEYLKTDESFWSNLKPSLREKILFKGIDDLNFDVVTRRKFNYAYIFTDSSAEYLDMVLHTYTPSGTGYKRTVRVMNERLYCRLSSYRILKNSHLESYVNDFVRRFIENGLYDKHLEWIRSLNRDVFQVNKYKTSNSGQIVLNMELLFGIFVLYIVGVVFSVIIFIFEMKI